MTSSDWCLTVAAESTEEVEAVSWNSWGSFFCMDELPMTEPPASLSHCRCFYVRDKEPVLATICLSGLSSYSQAVLPLVTELKGP